MGRVGKSKLKPMAKVIIFVLIVGVLWFALSKLNESGALKSIIPQNKGPVATTASPIAGVKPINVGVVTWGGYAGGEYFNGGFQASTNSRYYKEYGILVNFVVLDDYTASREAWKAGAVDLLWSTADSYCVETPDMPYDPRIVFQADWSRGGDAIVVREGIDSVADLKGKTIAVAFGTPSETFLLWLLDAAGMNSSDVKIVEEASAVDAAKVFKAEKVDCAVVWSPDDADCVNTVKGSKVLKSSRDAAHIIADVFYAKEEWATAHKADLTKLIEGWLKGAGEINTSTEAKNEAAKILSAGLNEDVPTCLQAINNTRLVTYGDNVNFFDLHKNFNGVTGETLYSKMSDIYTSIGLIKKPVPVWRNVIDVSALRDVNLEGVSGQDAEGEKVFTAVNSETGKNLKAFASKPVSISFESGSATLSDEAKHVIRTTFVPDAQMFSGSRIRVIGNTDNTGDPSYNRVLSFQRAQAAIDYMVSQYGFNRNRFIAIGNGPDKPVADNDSEEGRAKNRRTDFQLLNK
jgi:NitT/TauT family transport system substrate-binding protein